MRPRSPRRPPWRIPVIHFDGIPYLLTEVAKTRRWRRAISAP